MSVIYLVNGDGHRVVIDGNIDLPPKGSLDARACRSLGPISCRTKTRGDATSEFAIQVA